MARAHNAWDTSPASSARLSGKGPVLALPREAAHAVDSCARRPCMHFIYIAEMCEAGNLSEMASRLIGKLHTRQMHWTWCGVYIVKN